MSGKAIGGAVAAGAVLAAGCAVALLSLLGSSAPVIAGLAIGLGLGAGGAVLEVLLMGRAFRKDPRKAVNLVLTGLGLRFLVLMLLTVAFHWVPAVDETAFAISFVGGFVACLPAIGVVSGAGRHAGQGHAAHGEVRG